MDYDDNDFQSQNLHLAGEGSNKFPPVLRPYALPKFDFEESLHGSLRFDSLVETEVFLGIESNEDSQWIEDYSRGSGGVQFSSSAAESCPISRRKNVWSEATSSESVEMLLKSVGQEELIPAQANIKETDACDELGCIIKQMDPSLKQVRNVPVRADVTNLQSALLAGEHPVSLINDDDGLQQTQAEDSSQIHKGDESVDQIGADLTTANVAVRLPVAEENISNDGKGDDGNQNEVHAIVHESLDTSRLEGSGSGVHDNAATTGNVVLNLEDGLDHVNKNADENLDVSGTDNSEYLDNSRASSDGARRHASGLTAEMAETVDSPDGSLSTALVEPTKKTVAIETNLSSMEDPSTIPEVNTAPEISDQSKVDAHDVSLAAFEGNATVEGPQVEYTNLEKTEIFTKFETSLSSNPIIKASQDIIDGSRSGYGAVGSSLPEVCSSAELVSAIHAGGHTSLPPMVGSTQTLEDVVPRKGDIDHDILVDKKGGAVLLADDSNTEKSISKGAGTSSFGEVSTEKELLVSKLQSDFDAVNVSGGTLVAFGSGINADLKDVELSSLPSTFTCSDKVAEIAAQTSAEGSLAVDKATSQAASGLHCVSAVDTCNLESQIEPQAGLDKVGKDSTKDKEAGEVLCVSNENNGDSTEAAESRDHKKITNAPESIVNTGMQSIEHSVTPVISQSTSQIGQEAATVTVSEAAQGSHSDHRKPASSTPIAARATELSHDRKKKRIEKSLDHSVQVSELKDGQPIEVQPSSKSSNQMDISKDESSFTFEVVPLTQPLKDAGKWQTFSNAGKTQASSKPLDASALSSGVGLQDPNISQNLSHANPKIPEVATPRTGSKVTTERKPRRSSAKSSAKETAKKGKPAKEAASVRLERGDKTAVVSISPSGVPQLVQSSDMQRYGHIDSNSIKQFAIVTSTSGLPDLNSSVSQAALFQQPFTDLQQVQLRAQIFVYGALIQGTAPDEAYMISAFGGLDGGRSIWETAWRTCIERSQKSHISTPETPVQSRSGARTPEQSSKQSALQSKVVSSPMTRGGTKSIPQIVNPIVPFSSPLWSMPTPSGDALQSGGLPRGAVMDYQRALSPMHPHQSPAVRNFVGHGPWLPQASFSGPWVASPPTSALDNSGRFSVQLPITEPIQLTPGKEFSVPHSSGAKPTTLPVGQTMASASLLPLPSVPDLKMATTSASQPSVDPKPRKRKKTLVKENSGQILSPVQPQLELVTASPVTNSLSASSVVNSVSAASTPIGFFSKAPIEKFITGAISTPSTDIRKGEQHVESRAVLSEESLGEVTEAKAQAEVAAAHAASAISRSEAIWDQLNKQRNSGFSPDVELKLASAAVSVAAAAAVAKAAAAAAKVASNAALQAKMMAEEAFISIEQSSAISFSDGMNNFGKATPASILKGDGGTNSTSSILVAAREAAKRRVEAASAASKRAENMDAIVKAAELAAEAVSQAGKIVAMGDPLPLSELVAAGPEGYWKLTSGASELVSRENINVNTGAGPESLARQLQVPSDKKDDQIVSLAKSPIPSAVSCEDRDRLGDGMLGSSAITTKERGQKSRKASNLVASESGNGSKSSTIQNEYEHADSSKEQSINEDSNVEVFKDGDGFKAAWFLAKVLRLQDGKAHVNYSDLTSSDGSERLKEWVPLEGEGDGAPKIRIPRPTTVMPFEGTRKRRRAALGEQTWSVGDRVDAWMQDSWWEGVITEKSKKDESLLVNFPANGETLPVSKWKLRPSLIWKNGEWIECTGSGENNHSSHGGDTPQEKRPRMRSPVMDGKGKDKASKTIDATESDKSDDPTLLALTGDEKLFNIGKSNRDGNRTDALRMTRTGLQKEGSRVVFGVPKPGKKRKFMEVSKHYVGDRSGRLHESNDTMKFSKYMMPQGPGSRGWKSTSRTEINEKRAAISKPRVLKSGKPQNVSGRAIPQKENLTSSSLSIPDDSNLSDHVAKTKDTAYHSENASEKQSLVGFQSFSTSGATEGPILFSAVAPPSDTAPSKKLPSSNAKPKRVSKGKLAPAGSKLGRIEEDKAFNDNSGRQLSDSVEPRRSNRRIQPTSRLLEGLQSSMIVSKMSSTSHDKSNKSRTISRGNNHG